MEDERREQGRFHELPDDGIEGEERGRRMPVKMQDPKLPSPAEEKEHTITHLPYRPWCVHCVRGEGGGCISRPRILTSIAAPRDARAASH